MLSDSICTAGLHYFKTLVRVHVHCRACLFLAITFGLILKARNIIAADDILILFHYLSKKIRLDFSCESSA